MYRELLAHASELRHELPEAAPGALSDVPDRFRLFEDGVVSVVYAPVDYVNRQARVVILGITPGWHQTQIAYETSIALRGASDDAVGREVKRKAAFAGSMRRNLVTMLDELGVPRLLDLRSTEDLFAERADLLHSTSAFRYPVFKDGLNFSGYDPEPSKHPFLLAMLTDVLAPELAAVPDALIIPLGKSVEVALELLTARGLLSSARWLSGFPHPSGANGHRTRLFELRKEELRAAATRWFGRTMDEAPPSIPVKPS